MVGLTSRPGGTPLIGGGAAPPFRGKSGTRNQGIAHRSRENAPRMLGPSATWLSRLVGPRLRGSEVGADVSMPAARGALRGELLSVAGRHRAETNIPTV